MISADLRVAQHEVLEHALRQPRPVERLLEPLGHQQRRGRMLQHHRVARHQRRDDRVDGGEIGIVPRRDREDHAERVAPDVAHEAVLGAGIDVGQRLLGDADHVAGALLEPAQLRPRHSAPVGPSARPAPARSRPSWRSSHPRPPSNTRRARPAAAASTSPAPRGPPRTSRRSSSCSRPAGWRRRCRRPVRHR